MGNNFFLFFNQFHEALDYYIHNIKILLLNELSLNNQYWEYIIFLITFFQVQISQLKNIKNLLFVIIFANIGYLPLLSKEVFHA